MVVMLGVDVHKDTHTIVGTDELGRRIGERTVRATDAGHRQPVRWARHHIPSERVWAVEDCRHGSARLQRALLAAGDRVVRVAPKLMAEGWFAMHAGVAPIPASSGRTNRHRLTTPGLFSAAA